MGCILCARSCPSCCEVNDSTTLLIVSRMKLRHNACLHVSLVSQGIDTKSHPVVNEIVRAQTLLEDKLDPTRAELISQLRSFIERRKADKLAPKPGSGHASRTHTEDAAAAAESLNGAMSSDFEDSDSELEPEPHHEKPSKRKRAKKRQKAPSTTLSHQQSKSESDPTFVDETNLFGDDFDASMLSEASASESEGDEDSPATKKRKVGDRATNGSDDEEEMSEPSDIDQVFEDFFGTIGGNNNDAAVDSDNENPAHGGTVHIGFGKKKSKSGGGKSSSSGSSAQKSTKNATKRKKGGAAANANEDALWDYYQSFASKSEKKKSKKEQKKAKKEAAEAAMLAEEEAQLAALGCVVCTTFLGGCLCHRFERV